MTHVSLTKDKRDKDLQMYMGVSTYYRRDMNYFLFPKHEVLERISQAL